MLQVAEELYMYWQQDCEAHRSKLQQAEADEQREPWLQYLVDERSKKAYLTERGMKSALQELRESSASMLQTLAL